MNLEAQRFNDGLQEELSAMWRFALRLTYSEDDAADLVQRTCVRALEQSANYTDNGKLRSWLFRIEHRIWLNELRYRNIRQHSSFSYMDESRLDLAQDSSQPISDIRFDQPEGSVLAKQIVEFVNELPENQRIVMLLVNVEGFSYSEAADILETPIGTIMSRLSRARMTVGKKLLVKSTGSRTLRSSNDSRVST